MLFVNESDTRRVREGRGHDQKSTTGYHEGGAWLWIKVEEVKTEFVGYLRGKANGCGVNGVGFES